MRIIFGFLLCAFIFSATSAWAEDARQPYRIGAILPLSGQVASLGLFVKNGLDLALEGLAPDLRASIEVVYEDDQFEPAKTVTVYRNLKNRSTLDAVFVLGSPPANALVPIVEKDKTILVAIGASDPAIAVGKRYSFIHWVIPASLGKTLADEVARRNFKRIAFVAGETTGGRADVEAAVTAITAMGHADRIVYQGFFPRELTDFRSVLADLKHKNADLVVAVLYPGAVASFAKQFRAARLNAELAGMETFEDADEVKAAGGALLGTWYVNANDATSEFVTEYSKRFGRHPGWGAANGYDTLKIIADAVKRKGKTAEEVREYLASLEGYTGACGRYSATGDNRFSLPAALKRITTDGFVSQ